MGQTGFPQAEMDAALARLRRTYERMDAEIEKSGGPWLLGKDISLADVAVMPALVRMHDLGLPGWQDLPRIVTWFDNIRAHPAFKPTFYPGSLAERALSAFAGKSAGLTGRARRPRAVRFGILSWGQAPAHSAGCATLFFKYGGPIP